MSNYMEAKKRGFLLVGQVPESRRNGVFQNVEAGNYEYWQGGKLRGSKPFSEAPTRESVGRWLDTFDQEESDE